MAQKILNIHLVLVTRHTLYFVLSACTLYLFFRSSLNKYQIWTHTPTHPHTPPLPACCCAALFYCWHCSRGQISLALFTAGLASGQGLQPSWATTFAWSFTFMLVVIKGIQAQSAANINQGEGTENATPHGKDFKGFIASLDQHKPVQHKPEFSYY